VGIVQEPPSNGFASLGFSGSLPRVQLTNVSANSGHLSTLCLWGWIPSLARSLL
jgi:hypothetical protein